MRVAGAGGGVMSMWRGSRRERKKISSLSGPAMKFRQPIQLLSVERRSWPVIQSRHPESMIARSKSGPANRRAVRRRGLRVEVMGEGG